MANELDETKDPLSEKGRDAKVIEKQVKVPKEAKDVVFEVALWVCGILPGLIFFFMKQRAKSYLQAVQQKIQAQASTIDNYMEQRVQILKNAAKLLDKAVDLDKEILEKVSAYRGGVSPDQDTARVEMANSLDQLGRSINVAFEQYPNIQAHNEIQAAMQQNAYLQKEITAARDLYNDAVLEWNQAIFQWPTKKIVASRAGYTSRIPFSISDETRQEARSTFF